MTGRSSGKVRLAIEIAVCFFLMTGASAVFGGMAELLKADGLWVGVLSYLTCALLIILYVTKITGRPLSSVGLKRPVCSDIPKGLLLGTAMFLTQQLPLLLMGMDYSVLERAPDWSRILLMSAYCFFCVGVTEELMFRGLILHKTEELCNSKAVAVAINCGLFYMFHWPPVRFVFGEVFNIVVNTLFLSIYFYRSRNKSIVPLMIAHGFYDILSAYLLPVFLFYTTVNH